MQQLARTKNKRIEIIVENENATDEDGFPIEGGKSIKTVFANVRSLRGKEFYQASQVQMQDDKVFYINYFKGLDTKVEIKYKNELYNIISIVNIDEANREYEVRARLVKASG
ncbi:phage head closure protein [Clostridium botulinum]|nr:phage head closure protein [Clostridium botulinum]